jgi:hypothetical protein
MKPSTAIGHREDLGRREVSHAIMSGVFSACARYIAVVATEHHIPVTLETFQNAAKAISPRPALYNSIVQTMIVLAMESVSRRSANSGRLLDAIKGAPMN